MKRLDSDLRNARRQSGEGFGRGLRRLNWNCKVKVMRIRTRAVLLGMILLACADIAQAQKTKPYTPPPPRINDAASNIADVINSSYGFDQKCNYMSRAGYFRFRVFKMSGIWISRGEADNTLFGGTSLDENIRLIVKLAKTSRRK